MCVKFMFLSFQMCALTGPNYLNLYFGRTSYKASVCSFVKQIISETMTFLIGFSRIKWDNDYIMFNAAFGM